MILAKRGKAHGKICFKKTPDGQPKLPRHLHQRVGTALQCGIDQGEPVLFVHQIDIDEAIIRQLNQVVSMLLYLHVVDPFSRVVLIARAGIICAASPMTAPVIGDAAQTLIGEWHHLIFPHCSRKASNCLKIGATSSVSR